MKNGCATDSQPFFGMIFENIPRALASDLHAALKDYDGYLGPISMHFEVPAHLALYRLGLPTEFRLQGKMFRQFDRMGNPEGYEVEDLNEMKQLGYPRAVRVFLLS